MDVSSRPVSWENRRAWLCAVGSEIMGVVIGTCSAIWRDHDVSMVCDKFRISCIEHRCPDGLNTHFPNLYNEPLAGFMISRCNNDGDKEE